MDLIRVDPASVSVLILLALSFFVSFLSPVKATALTKSLLMFSFLVLLIPVLLPVATCVPTAIIFAASLCLNHYCLLSC